MFHKSLIGSNNLGFIACKVFPSCSENIGRGVDRVADRWRGGAVFYFIFFTFCWSEGMLAWLMVNLGLLSLV